MSGLMSVTGFPEGEPVRVGLPISDLVAATYAAYGIVVALVARQRSGQGQEVQVPLMDAMVSFLSFQVDKYFGRGEVPERAGNDHPVNSPYGTFRAQDGYINIAPVGDETWVRLVRALGQEDLIRDPRLLSNALRCQNRRAINQIVDEITSKRRVAKWVERLNHAEVPCGPIYDLSQVCADPQVHHQKMVLEVEQPSRRTRMGSVPPGRRGWSCVTRLRPIP
jgi:crotonobetainyl-CoA:carnitine CoA-transferase CaiB-like acyl-CoA transferase